MSNPIALNTRLAYAFIKEVLTNASHHHNPCLSSAPGMGKTQLVGQAARETGHEFVITYPVIEDPTDLKGFPSKIPVGDGFEATFLPFGKIRELLNTRKPTVVLVDDLGHGSKQTNGGYLQMFDPGRRIGDYTLPDCVKLFAATNRKEDMAGADYMGTAMQSRVTTIELIADKDIWVEDFAYPRKLSPDIIAYLRSQPQDFHNFNPREVQKKGVNYPCPRTWEKVANKIADGLILNQVGEPHPWALSVISGDIGPEAGARFMGFIRLRYKMPDPGAVILSPDTADVPSDPEILYALTAGLAGLAERSTMDAIVTYTLRLPREFGVYLINDIVGRDPGLRRTKGFNRWAVENPELYGAA
jgi:hypothetical protein